MVTSLGKPTVHVLLADKSCAPPVTSTSFVVPETVSVVEGDVIAESENVLFHTEDEIMEIVQESNNSDAGEKVTNYHVIINR